MHVIHPQPLSLLLQQCAPPLKLSVVDTPPPLLSISLQVQGGPPTPPSVMRAYAPLISALLTQIFDPPLQPSNVPATMPQISALPLQPLALHPPPQPSVSLQGQGGPLVLLSVAHDHAPLLPALHLLPGVTPILPSNVPAPLAHISALNPQKGRPCLQNSAVNPPPPILALLLQLYVLPLQPSDVCDAPLPPPLSLSIYGQGGPPSPNFSRARSCSSTLSLSPSAS